jgi:hypothetical protein
MKQVLLLLSLFFLGQCYSQENKINDDLTGIWITGTGTAKVEIYRNNNTYQGKVVWLKEPIDPKTGKPKTDIQHPDKSLHNRPIIGLVNLWGFHYAGNNEWEGGHIYDPKNGKEYKCVITMKDKNILNVRGYIGITLIGRTDTWTRTKL